MIHPYDAIKDPINSKHPIYRAYKKLYQYKDRYKIGEEIFIICFYHDVLNNRQYNPVEYYIRRCKERTISGKDIKFEVCILEITEKNVCFFEMDGYAGHLINNKNIKLTNKVPHLSFYHDSFPKVFYEWKSDNLYKSFVDYNYCSEISKTTGNRFREVFIRIKAYREIYLKNKQA